MKTHVPRKLAKHYNFFKLFELLTESGENLWIVLWKGSAIYLGKSRITARLVARRALEREKFLRQKKLLQREFLKERLNSISQMIFTGLTHFYMNALSKLMRRNFFLILCSVGVILLIMAKDTF